jgi:hypothetical protein
MGARGADVARESAALVIADDDFTSLVGGIRQGRGIFGNPGKAMAYVIAVHVPVFGMSLIPVFVSGWPLVLLPVQIAFPRTRHRSGKAASGRLPDVMDVDGHAFGCHQRPGLLGNDGAVPDLEEWKYSISMVRPSDHFGSRRCRVAGSGYGGVMPIWANTSAMFQ